MNEKLKVTKVSDDEYEYEISGGIKSWQTGAENPNDVRPFVIVPFDQVRNTVAQELVQQRRQQAVDNLLKTAKVKKGG